MEKKYVCSQGYEVEVLSSGAGFYIGTLDPEDGCPNCRLSVQYWKKKESAEVALKTGDYTDRSYAGETQFCNKGKGCLVREALK